MKSYSHKNFVIHEFDELASTNDEAFAGTLCRRFVDSEIVLAKKQNAGKGRAKRNWHSPLGNLYFSLILRPKISADKVAQLSFLAIVTLRLALERIAFGHGISLQNKWPNDLLINGKKVAGLLLESKINGDECEFAIIGIGVNIASKPDATMFPSACLQDFFIEISAAELLQKFLDEFEILYKNWLSFGFAGVRKLWLDAAFKKGEEIFIKEDSLKTQEKISGIFEDLDEEGSLILRTANGRRKISAADVF